jgi:hypothetical protein
MLIKYRVGMVHGIANIAGFFNCCAIGMGFNKRDPVKVLGVGVRKYYILAYCKKQQ